jgi:hypothetical protein
MRVSTRVRNVLIGAVSAAALTPDGATFWIYDRGTHALEVASTERAWFTRQWQTTRMVGVARTKAQACIEVHDRHGMSAPICTPFFGH